MLLATTDAFRYNLSIRAILTQDREAVLAARAIQSRWRARREALADEFGVDRGRIGVGVGIDSGQISLSESSAEGIMI